MDSEQLKQSRQLLVGDPKAFFPVVVPGSVLIFTKCGEQLLGGQPIRRLLIKDAPDIGEQHHALAGVFRFPAERLRYGPRGLTPVAIRRVCNRQQWAPVVLVPVVQTIGNFGVGLSQFREMLKCPPTCAQPEYDRIPRSYPYDRALR